MFLFWWWQSHCIIRNYFPPLMMHHFKWCILNRGIKFTYGRFCTWEVSSIISQSIRKQLYNTTEQKKKKRKRTGRIILNKTIKKVLSIVRKIYICFWTVYFLLLFSCQRQHGASLLKKSDSLKCFILTFHTQYMVLILSQLIFQPIKDSPPLLF